MLDFEKRDIVDVIMVMGLYDVEFVKLIKMQDLKLCTINL
jgi:hypothetical protein